MPTKTPSEADKHIGARIHLQRKARDISQEELSKFLGISFQQLQKYEKGTNRVTASRLLKIAQALGVPLSFFFEGLSDDPRLSNETLAIQTFISSREGIDFAFAFNRIENPAMRRALLELARVAANS